MIPLTAGTHHIAIRYCPPGLAGGVALGAFAILMALLRYWPRVESLGRKDRESAVEQSD